MTKPILLSIPTDTKPVNIPNVKLECIVSRKKMTVTNCGYINQYRVATLKLLQNQAY